MGFTFAVAALFAVAGCSGDDDSATGSGERGSAATTAEGFGDAVGSVNIINTEVGPVIGDDAGFTLYAFDGDSQGTSDCVAADCIRIWPPALTSDPVTGEGVEGGLVGGIDRDEGRQLTYAGRPLYRFSGDNRAGEIKGCGTAGRWWPVAADGSRRTSCAATIDG